MMNFNIISIQFKPNHSWGTNDDLIIQILAHRNGDQCKKIQETYHETHGEDLLRDLDSELSSDFQPTECDVYLVNQATKKLTASNWVIMEATCTRSSHWRFQKGEEYKRRNIVPLDCAITGDTSGDYEKMLLALMGHGDAC
ncbi:putative Annexin superfamily [Helianthus anomalus]